MEFLQHLNSVTYWFKDPGGVGKLNHVNPWVEWGIGSGYHFSLSSGRRKTQVLYLVICNRLRTQMDLQSVNGFMSGPIPSFQPNGFLSSECDFHLSLIQFDAFLKFEWKAETRVTKWCLQTGWKLGKCFFELDPFLWKHLSTLRREHLGKVWSKTQ